MDWKAEMLMDWSAFQELKDIFIIGNERNYELDGFNLEISGYESFAVNQNVA